jgi:DNA mismatch repair ATPase MutS
MLNDSLWQFTGIEYLYEQFTPLTPYGIAWKNSRELITDHVALKRIYDLTEAALEFINAAPEKADKVSWHLRRLPMVQCSHQANLQLHEIFQYKKFLLNYRQIIRVLPEELRQLFGLSFDSEELLSKLDIDKTEHETFYVSSKYDDNLRVIRQAIGDLDDDTKKRKAEFCQELIEQFQLDFRFRDFLVIPNESVAALGQDRLFLEPYDSCHVIVKPIFDKAYQQLLANRSRLVAKEKQLEQKIGAELSEWITNEAPTINGYTQVARQLDIAFAHARLALQFNLTRPVINTRGIPISIKNGKLLPMAEQCSSMSLQYWPLNVDFSEPVAVLHGSNMSGKTAVLQTIGFLQLSAQLGMFVSADKYETMVFDEICFVGNIAWQKIKGLSTFGQEMAVLIEALQNKTENAYKLLLIDELARTTNSAEATALLSGLLQSLSQQTGLCSYIASHYYGLPKLAHLAYYKMKGINWAGLLDKERSTDRNLTERIQVIQKHMQYEIEPDNAKPDRDAIRIARLLGLNSEIVDYAQQYLDQENVL